MFGYILEFIVEKNQSKLKAKDKLKRGARRRHGWLYLNFCLYIGSGWRSKPLMPIGKIWGDDPTF